MVLHYHSCVTQTTGKATNYPNKWDYGAGTKTNHRNEKEFQCCVSACQVSQSLKSETEKSLNNVLDNFNSQWVNNKTSTYSKVTLTSKRHKENRGYVDNLIEKLNLWLNFL